MFEPVARTDLAARIADVMLGVRRPHPVRVAIDGPDAAGKTTLADELVAPLRLAGRPVIRVSADDFHQQRSIRYRHGRDDPDGRYRDAFNTAALVREVLAPLGPGGSRRYLPTLWDLEADRATRAAYAEAPDAAVLVLDGLYLQRPELAEHFDLRCYLDVSDETVLRRAAARGDDLAHYPTRYLPARRIYEAEARPAGRADVVVRYDDLRRPALLLRLSS